MNSEEAQMTLWKNLETDIYTDTKGIDFFPDLCEAHGLDWENQLVNKMYVFAWKNGFEGGYREVADMFSDLVDMNSDIGEIFGIERTELEISDAIKKG